MDSGIWVTELGLAPRVENVRVTGRVRTCDQSPTERVKLPIQLQILAIYAITLLKYTVASPDPSNPRGWGLTT